MTTTEKAEQKYHELIDKLKTERGEIRLKMHLASMGVREEWKAVEDKWEHFKFKTAQFEKEAGNSAHELGEAIELLGGELKETYKRFRKIL